MRSRDPDVEARFTHIMKCVFFLCTWENFYKGRYFVPTGSDAEAAAPGDANPRTPPKTAQSSLPSTSTGPSVSVASAPPVVTVAPTHAHLSLPEMRKPPVEGYPEMERVAPEDIVRGFQPYRAPDLPTVSGASAVTQAPLRPTLPLDLAHTYPPYPSLYSHHLSHQYR